jgi:hypothetical protein
MTKGIEPIKTCPTPDPKSPHRGHISLRGRAAGKGWSDSSIDVRMRRTVQWLDRPRSAKCSGLLSPNPKTLADVRDFGCLRPQ